MIFYVGAVLMTIPKPFRICRYTVINCFMAVFRSTLKALIILSHIPFFTITSVVINTRRINLKISRNNLNVSI